MFRSSLALKHTLLKVACVLLLLAQHTALAHAVWHAVHELPAQHPNLDGKPAKNAASLCAFDVAIGEVLGGMADAGHVLPPCEAAAENFQGPLPICVAAQSLVPRSRGPPLLS